MIDILSFRSGIWQNFEVSFRKAVIFLPLSKTFCIEIFRPEFWRVYAACSTDLNCEKKLQWRKFHKINWTLVFTVIIKAYLLLYSIKYLLYYIAIYRAIFDATLHSFLLNFSILRALYIVLRVCFSLNCQFCLIWLSGEKNICLL